MARRYADWIGAYCSYASYGEAPPRMHFWAGVSAVAGALRRRVWIDQAYFKWYPNFYIVLVAPPGVVSKSTTAGVAMRLLRRVPGILWGPEVVTWQALVTAFANAKESFEAPAGSGLYRTMSALTIESSEFGTLLDPQDRGMVDLLVSLWDGKDGIFEKRTKKSGDDSVENPWINIIACTTPSWISGNFPEYMIGGGFTSRCLFVYAQEKARYIAYPALHVPGDLLTQEEGLVADLEHIATAIAGEYKLDSGALAWGTRWYEHHYRNRPAGLDDDRFGGYIARKQTHIHKLAMILAASQRDALTITEEDLATANTMVSDLEAEMPLVFSRIGRPEGAMHVDRFVAYINRGGRVPYEEAYRYIHSHFPSARDFEDMVLGAVKSGLIIIKREASGFVFYPGAKAPSKEGKANASPAA